ncbi:hypothetical protein [Streptomyces lydicus]|uniref:hypothetical protein n=1 Tax=Streptomyces lydicus TaxID=47763 RepID=UPI0036E4F0C1
MTQAPLLVQRMRWEAASLDDVGNGSVDPNEWPYFEIKVPYVRRTRTRTIWSSPTSRDVKWGRAAIHDALAHDYNTAKVEVSLSPDFYDKSQEKFSPFAVRVTTIGDKA